ncbi:MAG: lipopolysaccharide transport periplasmic protein LptA [Verrucomicrobiota bacterium]
MSNARYAGQIQAVKSRCETGVPPRAVRCPAYFRKPILLVATLAIACGLCFAEEQPASTNTTVVTSDTMTYDYKRSVAEFEGSVKAVDGNVEIRSDILRVFFGDSNSIKAATAIGNVQVLGQNRKAKCDRAVYFVAKGEIVLTGNAEISEDKNQLRAEEITFWVNDDKLRARRAHLRVESRDEAAGGSEEKDSASPLTGKEKDEDPTGGGGN